MAILVLMISSLTLTAFAADETKAVTFDKTYTFVISPSQFPSYMNSPSSYVPSTYYYDDGIYKGTLKLTSAICSSPTATGSPIGSQLGVKIFTKYAGTVIAKTKTVTYNKNYTFVVSPSQFPNYMNSPSSYVPSTYYYNDGAYKGTLKLTSAVCSSPTATGSPVGSQLGLTIFTKYSGTVLGN